MVRIAVGVFGLLTVAIFILAIYNDKGAVNVYQQQLKLAALQKLNQDTEQEIRDLTEQNRSLIEDESAIEKIAREQLGFVKPGEIILVLPHSEEAPSVPAK